MIARRASEKMKQDVVSRRTKSAAKRSDRPSRFAKLRANARLIVRVSAALMGIVLLVFLYRSVASSSSFQLRVVEVRGNFRVGTAEVERTAKERVSGPLFSASLANLQDDLGQFTWVKNAQVTRILPDTLRIRIEERK